MNFEQINDALENNEATPALVDALRLAPAGDYVRCPNCRGEGGWEQDYAARYGDHTTRRVSCEDCHGNRELSPSRAADWVESELRCTLSFGDALAKTMNETREFDAFVGEAVA